jgi:hypothetical protein
LEEIILSHRGCVIAGQRIVCLLSDTSLLLELFIIVFSSLVQARVEAKELLPPNAHLVNKTHHHLAHIDKVLPRQIVIVHGRSSHLSPGLVSKVLGFFSVTFHFLCGLSKNKITRGITYIRKNKLESLLRVLLHSLSFNLILGVYSPLEDILLLEKLLFLFHQLGELSIVLLVRLLLKTLSLSQGDCLLTMVLEPGTQLVVEHLT